MRSPSSLSLLLLFFSGFLLSLSAAFWSMRDIVNPEFAISGRCRASPYLPFWVRVGVKLLPRLGVT